MDKSEEERIFMGPFPWERAGFIVVHSGMAIRHLAPEMPTSDSGDLLIGRPKKAEREFFGGYHEMKRWFDQRSGDISHADKKLRRDEIREQLATEWEQLRSLGRRAEGEYLKFKEQVMSSLKGTGVEKSGTPSHDFDSQAICRKVRLSSYPQWAYVWQESHIAFSDLLDEAISNFNLLAGKYKHLREKRRRSTLGNLEELPKPGEPDREYDPEPQVHQYDFSSKLKGIFQAIVDVIRENRRLLETNKKTDILRLVYKKVKNSDQDEFESLDYDEEGVKPNKVNSKIWSEMKRSKGMDEIYPESPQELIELARKHPSTSYSPDE